MQYHSNLRSIVLPLVVAILVTTSLVTATLTLQSHIQPALVISAANPSGDTGWVTLQVRGIVAVDGPLFG